jgi:hypothetical protein
MKAYEEKLESALNVYRSLDRTLTNARLFGACTFASISQLEDLRDEAFLKIEFYCVDHILAFEQLRKELNLKTQYDHA